MSHAGTLESSATPAAVTNSNLGSNLHVTVTTKGFKESRQLSGATIVEEGEGSPVDILRYSLRQLSWLQSVTVFRTETSHYFHFYRRAFPHISSLLRNSAC